MIVALPCGFLLQADSEEISPTLGIVIASI
jgi:hypothetical protein